MSRGPAPWKSSDVAWRGGKRPYDLIKELVVSGTVVAVLVLGLTLVFASPDPPALTFKEWSQQAGRDFAETTLSEVNATSTSATYGPPYQTTAQDGSTQGFGPISPQRWLGEAIPVDTFEDYVARPLGTQPDPDGAVARALDEWRVAGADQQASWSKAYREALKGAAFSDGYVVPAGGYGPLGTIIEAQYALARAGGLDNAIVANPADPAIWYSNDQTFALLYFGDSGQGGAAPDCISAGDPLPEEPGCWYYNQSVANDAPRFGGYLAGGTWGVINEVGNWPGAWWLAPYSFWYQWGYGVNGASGDLYAMILTALVSLPFLFLPWIPGLRDFPRLTRVYRVMWGDYYRLVARERDRRLKPTRSPTES
jgi:hypothetical protein